MPNFSGRVEGVGPAMYVNTDPTSANSALLPLGLVVESRDGRMWRWCKAGAADLVAGNCIQSAALVTGNVTNLAVSAASIGATAISLTPGTTIAANAYAEGYMQTETSTGIGYTYKISSNPAITGSAAGTITLEDPLVIAITTSTKVGIYPHPYQNVIQSPVTTGTGMVVGVAGYVITAAFNGWLQTFGPCATLSDAGAAAAHVPVSGQGGASAGATIAASAVIQLLGTNMSAGISAKCNLVYLRIG